MKLNQIIAAIGKAHALCRDSRGVVALESALVGIPMVVLIAGTIYAGLNITAMSALDSATRDAARFIRVSDPKDASDANTRRIICGYVNTFTTCSSLLIYVQNGATFAALPPPPVTGNTMQVGFNPGSSGNYVLIRVAMKTNLALNIAGLDAPMFFSTIVFRNE